MKSRGDVTIVTDVTRKSSIDTKTELRHSRVTALT